jgi:hypothetical protein
MSTPAQPRTVIVCLPAEDGTDWLTASMLAATCGHAMLTTNGTWLQPDGESFTDRLTYLRQAAEHLHRLPRTATVVALTT